MHRCHAQEKAVQGQGTAGGKADPNAWNSNLKQNDQAGEPVYPAWDSRDSSPFGSHQELNGISESQKQGWSKNQFS